MLSREPGNEGEKILSLSLSFSLRSLARREKEGKIVAAAVLTILAYYFLKRAIFAASFRPALTRFSRESRVSERKMPLSRNRGKNLVIVLNNWLNCEVIR